MKLWSERIPVATLSAALVLASCSAATGGSAPSPVQPGAPGESTRAVETGRMTNGGRAPYTEADAQFMRDMIVHHQQALEMAALVPERTDREDIRLLARRIEVSQGDEIALMRRWLEERGEPVTSPGGHAQHHGHHAGMPGMLSEEEMARLRAASGAEFDRLLLQFMIRHHQGALTMVEELFSRRGSGQDSEVFQFAENVAGDQAIEIDRMWRMLSAGG